MTAVNQSTRAGLMLSHGIAMLVLGCGLLYIRAVMTTWLFDLLGSAFALLLIAASLLFIALSDLVFVIESHHASALRWLLGMSVVAAAAGAFLAFYPGITVRGVCACAAAYSLLLGLGKFHLANHWRGAGREKAVLYALAGLSFVLSGLLVVTAIRAKNDRGPLLAIAVYSLLIGVQTLAARRYLLERQSAAIAA